MKSKNENIIKKNINSDKNVNSNNNVDDDNTNNDNIEHTSFPSYLPHLIGALHMIADLKTISDLEDLGFGAIHSICYQARHILTDVYERKEEGSDKNVLLAKDWVNVKERLPEESGQYLVINEYGDMAVLNYSVKHKEFNALDWFDEQFVKKYSIFCKYWMPLPLRPYKR